MLTNPSLEVLRTQLSLRGELFLSVVAKPGAKTSELIDIRSISGRDGSDQWELYIRIGAPADEGKANAELAHYLALLFDVSPSTIQLMHGKRGRNKIVRIC